VEIIKPWKYFKRSKITITPSPLPSFPPHLLCARCSL
jgi:hypothetical protein